MDSQESKRLLALWLSAEALSIPELSKEHRTKLSPTMRVADVDMNIGKFNANHLISKLADKCGSPVDTADEFDLPPQSTDSWICNLRLDVNGVPVPDSFSFSLFLWSAGYLLRNSDGLLVDPDKRNVSSYKGRSLFDGFEEFQHSQRTFLETLVSRMDDAASTSTLVVSPSPDNLPSLDNGAKTTRRVVTLEWLAPFVDRLLKDAGLSAKDLSLTNDLYGVVRSRSQHSAKQKSKLDRQDILASYFLSDLADIFCKDFGSLPIPLRSYLSQTPSASRIDVRSEQGLPKVIAAVKPDKFPEGRWPSDHALAYSQQAAINIMAEELEHEGLFTVNGPPGTGKTTLLRDVVAMVVTNRAKQLMTLDDPHQGYDQSCTLKPKLTGFSIVVASSNNRAVENVSLELPRSEAVSSTTPHSYFAEIGSALLGDGKSAWGMLTAKLGKQENRSAFVNTITADPYQPLKSPVYPRDLRVGDGLRLHLKLIENGRRRPLMDWNTAKDAFRIALERERHCRADMNGLIAYGAEVSRLSSKITRLQAEIKHNEVRLDKQKRQISDLCRRIDDLSTQCKYYADQEIKHHATKPGLLSMISTLGQSYRDHYKMANALHAKRTDHDASLNHLSRDLDRVRQDLDDLKTHHGTVLRELERSRILYSSKRTSPEMRQYTSLVQTIPTADDSIDARELKSPWNYPAWANARKSVFLAALDLHRSFIEATPSETGANLDKVTAWLNGGFLQDAQHALDSLCLITPVISTTFASVHSMFKTLGRGSIAWLLIDEAGQSTPQQAAGAMYRAKRVIVVGDPLQLEPISTVPKQLEAILGTRYRIDSTLWPSNQSVQTRSDATMRWGTYINAAEGGKTWVGVPLRVHRRCDNPMFSLSNNIAYDGLMVHGKDTTESHLPESAWIDQTAGSVVNKHWVVEEGQVLRQLVTTLREFGHDPEDIFTITPFNAVSNALKALAGSHSESLGLNLDNIGTIHTAQGQESGVVIFILGGDPSAVGDKKWASQKVNLVNVAVSRAKCRLFVIGNRDAWMKYNYFSALATRLPAYPSVDALVSAHSRRVS